MAFCTAKILSNVEFRVTVLVSRRYCQSRYEKDEAGRQPRVVQGKPYPEWRRPWAERDGEWYSKFKLFLEERNPSPDVLNFMQKIPDFSIDKARSWWRKSKEFHAIANQKYISERVEILGPDLAAAHFVCFREGAIKFKNQSNWLKGDPTKDELKLPVTYDDNYIVEMIDCSGFKDGGLRYEGLLNLSNLSSLKWLSLKNNIYVDEWGVDRIVGQCGQSLEYLDLSGCPIALGTIIALARIPNLKVLILSDIEYPEEIQAGIATLEAENESLLVKLTKD